MIYNQVINNLEKLKLDKMRSYLSTYLDEINKNNICFIDALYELTQKEIEFKEQRASEFNIKVAAFPFIRTLEELDFNFQPSINRKEILDLGTLRFIEKKKNIILVKNIFPFLVILVLTFIYNYNINNSHSEILGGYHMITANEARKKIDTLATKRGEEEKKKAEERITRAVENGESSCWLRIYISDATEKWLKSLGYQVRRMSNQRDGDDTEVRW